MEAKSGKEGFEFGSVVGTVGVEGECELRVEFGKNRAELVGEELSRYALSWEIGSKKWRSLIQKA